MVFAEVGSNFFGNTKDSDYKTLIGNMLHCFKVLGCRMSLKIHFLHARLDNFAQTLGDKS